DRRAVALAVDGEVGRTEPLEGELPGFAGEVYGGVEQGAVGGGDRCRRGHVSSWLIWLDAHRRPTNHGWQSRSMVWWSRGSSVSGTRSPRTSSTVRSARDAGSRSKVGSCTTSAAGSRTRRPV